MSINIIRTDDGWWVLKGDHDGTRIDTSAETTAGLLADRASIEAAVTGAPVPLPASPPVSPVTSPCRLVAQMTNFRSHIRDAGMDPDTIPLTFFRKTSASISGPTDDVVRPAHVRLLDYEVEIGLVIGKELRVGTRVDDVAEYVAALVLTNDFSARDVQLPQTQFYEAKSYPGFTPVGPRLVLLGPGDLDRFGDLELRTWVNGELRQESRVEGDMVYRPAAALAALARFQPLAPGDLIQTGTPVGTALSAPPKPIEILGRLLPPTLKWRAFFRAQARNPQYLQDGDVVELEVRTADGALDLGRQRTVVRFG
jgi:2-keto-4-pentenoate hydratase/2-oxohepta-3-ene-1,7-dioic acid hydratase in catechol pathway